MFQLFFPFIFAVGIFMTKCIPSGFSNESKLNVHIKKKLAYCKYVAMGLSGSLFMGMVSTFLLQFNPNDLDEAQVLGVKK